MEPLIDPLQDKPVAINGVLKLVSWLVNKLISYLAKREQVKSDKLQDWKNENILEHNRRCLLDSVDRLRAAEGKNGSGTRPSEK